MIRPLFKSALILGLITAVGPFAIDMYLPALPAIGRSLDAVPSTVQLSLTAYFVTIGICQLFYGPLTDIVGRKTPIYLGLSIFAAGSIGCAFAPTIGVLIGFRVVQAFGACAGMVVPRAIVRDMHTGHDATRLMSLLMLVMSISPILAPLTGSAIIAGFGWRGVFGALTVAAVIAFLLAATQLRETRLAHHRAASSWGGAFASYRRLLADRSFIGLAFVGAFGISSFFVYIGSASFVLITHFGLTPTGFSLCFALNAASFFGVSQFTAKLTARFGLPRVLRMAVTGFAAAMVVLAALMLAGSDNLVVMMAGLFVGYGFLGLVLPTCTVLALEHHGPIAGTASALMGSLQMVTGAAIMAFSGLFATGAPRPMVLAIAACAVTACLVAQLATRALPVPAAAE